MKLVVLYILVVPLVDPRLRRRSRCVLDDGEGVDRSTPARTGSPRSSTRSRRRRTTTAPPSAGSPATRHWYNTTLGARDARRPVPADRPGAGDRRLAGAQAAGAGVGRHVPDRHAAVRRPARRRRAHRRRPHLLPGRSRSGPIVEHLVSSERRDADARADRPQPIARRSASLFDPPILRPAVVDSVRQARPAPDGAQPGDVRRRGRQRPHHARCSSATSRRRHRRERLRRARRRCGCGSPCCSPTSPRRWPKAAARRRPTRCARPAPETVAHRAAAGRRRSRTCRRRELAGRRRVSSSRPARSSPATARSSRASPSVDESAITGESAPVIRESGGDRSAVTGGTRVLSDRIVVRDHRRSRARRSSTG